MQVKLGKVLLAGVFVGTLTVTMMSCAPVEAQQYTFQGERQMHPNMTRALEAMTAALHDLQVAPDTFGGNKGAAERDLIAAIHSTKRALYYRMRLDDAAIDRAP